MQAEHLGLHQVLNNASLVFSPSPGLLLNGGGTPQRIRLWLRGVVGTYPGSGASPWSMSALPCYHQSVMVNTRRFSRMRSMPTDRNFRE
jgi:hypothetical protein